MKGVKGVMGEERRREGGAYAEEVRQGEAWV